VRKSVDRLDRDRVLAKDIEAVAELIRSGAVERAVAEAVGPLA
jgi:histidine ammonia-lyase